MNAGRKEKEIAVASKGGMEVFEDLRGYLRDVLL